ncbi:hypothetical protein DFJ63DRAFT_289148 [Scheffersomyces coipomensis]|uniref:uncharacterized protein n=1 Tax=Scheffersomyces coipomensis TaxID=1788519 RepID=UPI00315C6058
MLKESSPLSTSSPPPPNLNSSNQNLAKLSKDDIAKRDLFGRTILHLLILCNRHDLLRNLLKNGEVKSILNAIDYENGWNCLHYCINLNRIICFNILIEHYKNSSSKSNSTIANNNILMDALRCKDRNGVAPIQLLGNDFKDLTWIPQYINEKNELHLIYRFGNQSTEDDDALKDQTAEQRNNNDNNQPNDNNDNNANNNNNNNNILRPLEVSWSSKRGGSEIYSFGSNANNQLGVGDSRDRSIPSRISHDIFKPKTSTSDAIQDALRKPRYKQFAISKNHSVVVTKDGEVYSSGIGSRGRLGHGFDDLNDYFKFKKIEFFNSNKSNISPVKEVAISNNHNIALTTDGKIYAWGLNSFQQLGFDSNSSAKYNQTKGFLETFQATPTLVAGDLKKNFNQIIGISVSKVHSVAYTKNEIFFWGLNVGQMGIPLLKGDVEVKLYDQAFKGEIQHYPRVVQLRDEIKSVDTSELCTCVVTTKNDIHVYYNYQHFKLPKIPTRSNTDKHFDIFTPIKLTQVVQIKKIITRSTKHCTVLLENGSVVSFSLNNSEIKNIKYTSVWKGYDHDMLATDIDVSSDGSIVLCTRNGSVFLKSGTSSNQRKNSMSSASYLPSTQSKFKKIDNLNKIVQVSCDINFLSFGFIRDDIDILPLKLQKNDFFKDIEYLCPLIDASTTRKQDQLLQVDHKFHTYISNFLYPDESYEIDDDEVTLVVSDSETSTVDLLRNQYNDKYDKSIHRRGQLEDSLDLMKDEGDISSLTGVLQSDLLFLKSRFNKDNVDISGKSYDGLIKLDKDSEIVIGFHKSILEARSSLFNKVLNPENEGDYFVWEDIKVEYDPLTSTLEFKNDITIESILLLLYAIYTGERLDIWNSYSSRQSYPPRLKTIFEDFHQLLDAFKVSSSFNGSQSLEKYLTSFQSILDDDSGDVLVTLSDGHIRCHSYILKARSAFFETVLSERWDTEDESKVLDFSGLSKFQFMVILRHLYGFADLEVFNCFGYDFHNQDEFINDMLELIEIADELLLFQLKSLCQLAIIDFISLDNVTILLTHSEYLSAPKLFMNCCWYIYNNLEILLFDSSLKDLSLDILKKLEGQIKYFQNCKVLDFANDRGELNADMLTNWFESDSNVLIGAFMNDMFKFNEFFISDRKGYLAFEPLIDVKYEVKPIKEASTTVKKKKSRKSSTLTNDILSFREAISKQKPEIISPIAIEDNHDGFETVSNSKQRRKSKVSLVLSPSPTPPSSAAPSRSASVVSSTASVAASPTIGGSSSSLLLKPSMAEAPQPIKAALSPFSNWASKNTSGAASPILLDKFQPILGKSVNDSNANARNGINSEWVKKSANVRIGPVVKLSQKERKRLAAAAAVVVNNDQPVETKPLSSSRSPSSIQPQTLKLPKQRKSSTPIVNNSSNMTRKPSSSSSTTVVSPSSSSSPAATSSIQFSTLATSNSVKVDTEFNKVYSTPSLTEVMIHDSLRLERLKLEESQRKTLAEIQQEEEFAKWWDEESKKVQKQLEGPSTEKKRPSNKNRKGSGGGNTPSPNNNKKNNNSTNNTNGKKPKSSQSK